MIEYRIEEHRDDSFSVYYAQPRTVRETTIEGGQMSTVERSYSEVFHVSDPSLFDAEYAGDNTWNVDLDCGAQRWRGEKTTVQVRMALKKCGFSRTQIDHATRAAAQDTDRAERALQSYRLTRLGGNVFTVAGDVGGQRVEILVSYETPVAYRTWVGAEETAERSETRFSRSTERHISDWQWETEMFTYTNEDGSPWLSSRTGEPVMGTRRADRHPYSGRIAQSELDRLMCDLTGDTRLRGKARAHKLGRTANTEFDQVVYDRYTDEGDANLFIPVERRR